LLPFYPLSAEERFCIPHVFQFDNTNMALESQGQLYVTMVFSLYQALLNMQFREGLLSVDKFYIDPSFPS